MPGGMGKVVPGEVSDYQTEWNLAQLASYQLHQLKGMADTLAIRVEQRDNSSIEGYYAVLHTIYRNIRPLIYPDLRDKMDVTFSNLRAALNRWLVIKEQGGVNNYAYAIADNLLVVHQNLLFTMQKLNLGWPTSKRMDNSPAAKGKRMLGLDQ